MSGTIVVSRSWVVSQKVTEKLWSKEVWVVRSTNQGGSNEKILVGPSLSNDDVIRAMTSLLPPSIQNIGGAAAPVAPPVATPLLKLVEFLQESLKFVSGVVW